MNNFHKKYKKFVNETNREFLKTKDSLHPFFWNGDRLVPNVTKRLLKITQDIVDSIRLDFKVQDVLLTGSLASYNWHRKSDIDLHLLIDFSDISTNTELVKKMFDHIRINWNKKHDITIHGHEVELYFQDTAEHHESKGIYSVDTGGWIAMPVRLEVDVDLKLIETKAENFAKSIRHAEELYSAGRFEEAHEFSVKLMRKIKRMRTSGLEDGVDSPENLAFKMLRNSDNLARLVKVRDSSYDKSMSIDLRENIFNKKNKPSLISEINAYFNEVDDYKEDSDYLKFDENQYASSIEVLLDESQPAPWGEFE